jgi:hypothetical protein
MKMSQYEVKWLNIIRDEVNNYLSSSNVSTASTSRITKAMELSLPKITPDKKFDVIINDASKQPFIMCIYPDIVELDKKAEGLVKILDDPRSSGEDYVKHWCEIQKWTIEIDHRLLKKGHRLCVTTGDEFVALLCHEIGHVMNENPLSLVYNYKEKKATMNKFNKIISSNSKIVRKLMLPMFIHTLQFRIVLRGNRKNRLEEIAADAYVPEEYRGSLVSYVEDHILKLPETASGVVVDTTEFDNIQNVGVEFSKQSVELMKDRIDVLKQQITAQYKSPQNSKYQQKLMSFIGMAIAGFEPGTEDTDIFFESSLRTIFNREYTQCMESVAVMESMVSKVTDRDIVILSVQVDDLKTTEDRLYLIHTIYDYIETLAKEEEMRTKKTKGELLPNPITDAKLATLYGLREKVMKAKVTDIGDRYGIFVKYPKGYEG